MGFGGRGDESGGRFNPYDNSHSHSHSGAGRYGRGGGGRRPGHNGGGGGWGNSRGGRFHRGGRTGGRGRGNRDGSSLEYDPSMFDPIEEIGDAASSDAASASADASAADTTKRTVRIAVEGCCHGELDLIYRRLQDHEANTGRKIDLLLCCGDFQSHRNAADFHSSSIPPKYRTLGTFPKYYAGEKIAPILTVFIGGNHEASQPLRELYYGGWVAPNIYYMGAAGVVQFAGLRIGGISGIYKSHDYSYGHHEKPPYDRSSLRSVYHVRNVDVYRMKCLTAQGGGGRTDRGGAASSSRGKNRRRPLDVMMSHDWPLGIEQYGNVQQLLRQKPYFRREVEENDLGSRPNREILDTIRPRNWFAAHLHVKFKATVRYGPTVDGGGTQSRGGAVTQQALIPSQAVGKGTTGKPISKAEASPPRDENDGRADQAGLPQDSIGNEAVEPPATTEFHGMESSDSQCKGVADLTEQMTRFLALDKCLPRRQFLCILNVPAARGPSPNDGNPETAEGGQEGPIYHLEYDPEWLTILRKTHHLSSPEHTRVRVPAELEAMSDDSELDWIEARIKERNPSGGGLRIPATFSVTVPTYSDPAFCRGQVRPLPAMGNPQTDNLLDMLQLSHVVTTPYDADLTPQRISTQLQGNTIREEIKGTTETHDSDEIDIDQEDAEHDKDTASDGGESEPNKGKIVAEVACRNGGCGQVTNGAEEITNGTEDGRAKKPRLEGANDAASS